MKNLYKTFNELENLYKSGVIFSAIVLLPMIILILRDILTNGSNL